MTKTVEKNGVGGRVGVILFMDDGKGGRRKKVS